MSEYKYASIDFGTKSLGYEVVDTNRMSYIRFYLS